MKEVKLKELSNHLNDTYDVFIVSASFEMRALSTTDNILDKIKFKHTLVVTEQRNREYILSNEEIFRQKEFEVILSNSLDQIFTVNNFLEKIEKILAGNPNASFLIDISTFTRQNLLILVRLLRNNLTGKNNNVTFLYTIASDYSIGSEQEKKWLSEGILEVHSIFGYAGTMLPSKPYHLIILMGYEVERAASLIDAYEPNKVTIGIANEGSSLSKKHYEQNEAHFNELRSQYPYAEKFEFSCIDKKAIDTITQQCDKYPNYNVVISPMNNKISTLFAGIASFIKDSVQVAISIPLLYNYLNYSTPSDKCIILDLSEEILKP